MVRRFAGISLASSACSRADNSGISTPATAEFFLATTVWAGEWVFAAAVALLGASLVAAIVAWATAERRNKPGLRIAYLTMVLQVASWSLVLTPFDFFIVNVLTHRFTASDKHLYLSDLYQYFFWQTIAICVVVGSTLATWIALQLWAKRQSASSWPAKTPPRLIVGGVIQLTLLAASLALMVFTLHTSFESGFDWRTSGGLAMLVTWLVLILLIAAVLYFDSQTLAVLHIVMDVVNHFHGPSAKFPIRRKIAARFRRVLDYMLATEKPAHLAVIAHSQGTIIAIESLTELRHGRGDCAEARAIRSQRICLRLALHLRICISIISPGSIALSRRVNGRVCRRTSINGPTRISDRRFRRHGYQRRIGQRGRTDCGQRITRPIEAAIHYWTDAIFSLVASLLP